MAVLTMVLADFFALQRAKARLSMEEAAEKLNVAPSRLELFEQGQTPIPAALIFAMTTVYGTDPEAVLHLLQGLERVTDDEE